MVKKITLIPFGFERPPSFQGWEWISLALGPPTWCVLLCVREARAPWPPPAGFWAAAVGSRQRELCAGRPGQAGGLGGRAGSACWELWPGSCGCSGRGAAHQCPSGGHTTRRHPIQVGV